MLPASAEISCTTDSCNGTYSNGFCSADGTHYQPALYNEEENRYEIGNAGQLYWFAQEVASGNAACASATVVLTADITVNQGQITQKTDGLRQWNPIGPTSDAPFKGVFDGQGHTVSGLYHYSGNTFYNVGLVGYASKATVRNVNVVNFYFEADGSRMGGIVGALYGSTVENCYAEGTIYGWDAFATVGGIVGGGGAHSSYVLNCLANTKLAVSGEDYDYSIQILTGPKNWIGGIVGGGGGIMNNMRPVRTMSYERHNRISKGHKVTVRYAVSLTV